MGYENCGRKTISENSAAVKQKLAVIAKEGVKYLGLCAEGKQRPSPSRVNIILAAIDHTIGRAKQQVDTNISGQLDLHAQLRGLSEADLAALLGLLRQAPGTAPVAGVESEVSAQKKTLPDSDGST